MVSQFPPFCGGIEMHVDSWCIVYTIVFQLFVEVICLCYFEIFWITALEVLMNVLFFLSSQNHLNLVVMNNVPLFFNVRDGPYMPTLRLLHQCNVSPQPSCFWIIFFTFAILRAIKFLLCCIMKYNSNVCCEGSFVGFGI